MAGRGIGRLEDTISSLEQRIVGQKKTARTADGQNEGPNGNGDDSSRPTKRRRIIDLDLDEVAGVESDNVVETEASASLALAYDSPFLAILSPAALIASLNDGHPVSDKPRSAETATRTSSLHPPLEWVAICETAADAPIIDSNQVPAESRLHELEPTGSANARPELIGAIDITVKWTPEDADLLLIGEEDAPDTSNGGGPSDEADASDLFNRLKTFAENGLELQPVVSFRTETFRRQDSEKLSEVPILVCRFKDPSNPDAPPATLFAKPLVKPDVRLSTTGRYDPLLPMSIMAGNTSIPMGHGRKHRPAPTLLHAVYNFGRQSNPDIQLLTVGSSLSISYSYAENSISFRLILPLALPPGTIYRLGNLRDGQPGFFNDLTHDLLNHLHPAESSLKKDGKVVNREPRLEDLGGEIRDLYGALLPDKTLDDVGFRQPEQLDCTLLPFQRRAVQWMLSREGVVSRVGKLERFVPSADRKLRIHRGGFWEKVELTDDATDSFWIERMTGAVRPGSSVFDSDLNEGGYGVLAEEMGLGKTIQTLALVLSHKPGPQSRPAVNPPCLCGENVDGDEVTACGTCSRLFHADCVGSEPGDTSFLCSGCKGKNKGKGKASFSSGSASPASDLGNDGLPLIPATLIVTPQSILAQWIEEINTHAPSTNIIVYSGVKTGLETASDVVNGLKSKKSSAADESEVPDFGSADVVLTTYEVLQKEVWHAKDDSNRNRRFERRYERKTSPLVNVKWWRVCLDEAQRVESGVSAAAEMVGLIPRVHAWVVTGTPIGKAGIQDLHGLFLFLKQPHTLMDSILFRRALLPLPSYRNTVLAVLASMMHRNSKDHVKEDLSIPPQQEHIFPVNLKEVEREYYSQRWEACQEDLKAVLSGDPDDIEEVDVGKLRRWLLTLRQTCVHPQIGRENKRALGTQLIKSINDVLLFMVRQCSGDLTTAEKQLISIQVKRAQALEQRKAFQAALNLYEQLLGTVEKFVAEARNDVAIDKAQNDAEGSRAGGNEDAETVDGSETDQDTEDKTSGVTARLNAWLEVEHRLVYFIASVHNSLKNQALEDRFYERAEAIRQKILGPRILEVEQAKKKVAASESEWQKVDLQVPRVSFKGGITAQVLCGEAEATIAALNKQGANMLAWRKKVLDVLMTDLDHAEPENAEGAEATAEGGAGTTTPVTPAAVSTTGSSPADKGAPAEAAAAEGETGAKKPQGNEYQTSLRLQEEANVYHDAYKESLIDRFSLLNGAPRPAEGDVQTRQTTDLIKQLFKERALPKGLKDLKFLVQAFRTHGQGRMGVPDMELQLCQTESKRLNKEVERGSKMIDMLQKQNRQLNKLQNARIEYYRALQEISDSVEAGKFSEADIEDNYTKVIRDCLEDEKRLKTKILQLDGRKKYLHHLSEESPEGESRTCVICRDDYESAAITPCGHFFCLPCLTQWVAHHRKCPTCNTYLQVADITRVSFNNTKRKGGESALANALRRASSFCTFAEPALVSKVQKVHINGSFGGKLDTIIRHILSLDPSEKCVVFSQWDQVLELLAAGLSKNGIQYVRFQGPQRNRAAVQFRRNPDIRVFILDAKSQSSGLTLVNAAHVMLVEPILHPGIELQAINRVHRIGQTKVTHVWRYLVSGTIEEALFELYENRRLAVAGRGRDLEDADEEMGPDMENARMLPLTNRGGAAGGGGGELVGNTDIINLLKSAFGARDPDEVEGQADLMEVEKD